MKIAKLLVIAAIAAPLCRADDSLALANKYLELTAMPAFYQQSFESGIKSSLERMRAQGAPAELVDKIHAEAQDFFAQNFKWDEVRPKVAKLYSDAFTEAELRELIAFYQTPTGQKAVAKLPALVQESGVVAMSGVQAGMPQFQQRIGELIESYKKKEAGNPPAAVTVPEQPPK
jgi:hypothetical protein